MPDGPILPSRCGGLLARSQALWRIVHATGVAARAPDARPAPNETELVDGLPGHPAQVGRSNLASTLVPAVAQELDAAWAT
jgi:hypothetical protein